MSAAAAGATVLPGSALAGGRNDCHCNCPNCVRLGKIDKAPRLGATYTFSLDGISVTIEIDGLQDTEENDLDSSDDINYSEIGCFSFRVVDVSGLSRDCRAVICGVDVKGGPLTNERRFTKACGGDVHGVGGADPCAPFNENSGKKYGISNVVFYVCVPETFEASSSEDDGGPPETPPGQGRERENGRGRKRGRIQ